ncbi:MAG: 30S ribosomal protein S4 [Mycoplasmataceae bacterium]|nr:MAG: 30S ribosomal protein S4 [Mycoplasmataceae bacterium]
MSKYTGPLWKKSRALGISLLENKKEFSRGKKRTTPPGQHGANKKKHHSTYALRNKENQKILHLYGTRKRHLTNLVDKLKEHKENIGDNLLINCESRLDNLVLRSGLISTRRCARQLVSHGHFLVNGQKVKCPSYQVSIGQTISLKKEKMKESRIVKESLEQNIKTPPYLNFDKQNLTINYIRHPLSGELNKDINPSLVVESYR